MNYSKNENYRVIFTVQNVLDKRFKSLKDFSWPGM